MCSARDNAALPTLGLPIRESAGHWPFSASPRLIAAVHALHRLLVPRHPPCALTILTVIAELLAQFRRRNHRFLQGSRINGHPRYPIHWLLCSFQGPRRGRDADRRSTGVSPLSRRRQPVSQNSTACGTASGSRRIEDSPVPRPIRQVRSTCLVTGMRSDLPIGELEELEAISVRHPVPSLRRAP